MLGGCGDQEVEKGGGRGLPAPLRFSKPRLESAQWGRGSLERGRVGAELDKDAPGNAVGLGYSRSAGELEAERAQRSALPAASPLPRAGCFSAAHAAIRKVPDLPGKSPPVRRGGSRLVIQAEAEVPKVIWRKHLVEKRVLSRWN